MVSTKGSPQCGISIRPMSARGHNRRLPHRNIGVRLCSVNRHNEWSALGAGRCRCGRTSGPLTRRASNYVPKGTLASSRLSEIKIAFAHSPVGRVRCAVSPLGHSVVTAPVGAAPASADERVGPCPKTPRGVTDGIGSFADCTHNAGNRAAGSARTLRPFQDPFVVGRNGRYRKLRFHEHDLVAAGLEIVE